jgi:hypothetical protein
MSSKLSWRDAWLLPLISGCTVLFLLISAEVGARIFWPEQEDNRCIVHDHTILTYHFKPHCVSTMKAAEGPWYTNSYNECGYRSNSSCGPVAPGVRRIAIIGASAGESYLVEYPNSLGAKLGDDLTSMCHAPVDVQNLAAKAYIGVRVVARMGDALRLHPQAVLFVFPPYDVQLQLDNGELALTGGTQTEQPKTAKAAPAKQSRLGFDRIRREVSDFLRESRAVAIAQHFMFRNPQIYLPLFLTSQDKADFMRLPFTPAWQERLRRFDLLVGALASQAHAAGVPLILVFTPHQAEVAIAAGEAHPNGVDPNALPAAIRVIAERYGAAFVDPTPALAREPDPSELYYRVDGHLSGRGLPIVARYVAGQVAGMASGPFADCRASEVGPEPGKAS